MVKKKITRKQQDTGLLAMFNKKNGLYILVLIVATFIVFSPSLHNGFTNWDDESYVVENQAIKSLSVNDLGKFGENYVGNYQPLTMISYAVDYQIGELDPFIYHLTSIIFHLLNTVLVFLLLMRISKQNLFISFFTALIFGIHPMHVESVTWIAERKDVMYSFFFLIGLLLYYEYLIRKKMIFLVAGALAFILSALSKSAAVVFPIVLFLIDYFEKRKISTRSIIEKLPLLAISVWFGIKALGTQGEAIQDFEDLTIFERVRFAAYGFMNYIEKFIVPTKLSAFHPYPKLEALPVIYNLYLIGAVIIAALALVFQKKMRWVLFGLLFYLTTLILVLQLISVGGAIVAERYTYIPYVALGFIYLTFLDGLIKKYKKYKTVIFSFLGIQLFFFAVTTFGQTKIWKDSEILWTNVIEKYPDDTEAYINRGGFYRTNNEIDKAWRDFNKAIALDDQSFRAYAKRGKIYFDTQNFNKALEEYNRSLSIKPEYKFALSDRGACFGAMGQFDKALADLNKALEIDPKFINAYMNRAMVHIIMENYDLAAKDLVAYSGLKPDDPDVLNTLGVCYYQSGDYRNALNAANQAIAINGRNGAYLYSRSMIYKALNNKKNAQLDATNAKRLGYSVPQEYMDGLK